MKKHLSPIVIALFMVLGGATVIQLSGCAKTIAQGKCPTSIHGLWEGTYLYQDQPPLYFSFTIYPDGSISYKSKGIGNNTFNAYGTWQLRGNEFKYRVQVVDAPYVPVQPVQEGSAIYDASKGTLTEGVNVDVNTKLGAIWSMNKTQ